MLFRIPITIIVEVIHNMSDTKVCQLIPTLSPGGAETMVLRLVENASTSVSHTVCYFDGKPDNAHHLVEKFEAAGADVHFCESSILYDPRGLYQLYSILRKGEFDVVHNHLIHTHPIGRVVGKLAQVDTVVSTHHGVINKYGRHFQILERATRWLDNTTVAYSDGVKNPLPNSWKVIYNGINVKEFRQKVQGVTSEEVIDLREKHDINHDDHLFLNISRYVPEKSQQTAINAFKNVLTERDDVHLVLVGYGPLEEDYQSLVTELGISDRVTVTGQVPSVIPYYAAADVFVFTYSPLIKDWGIVSLEAMAASLPIIATETQNMSTVVKDGRTGYLVPLQDPPAMATAILNLCDSAEQKRLGDRGYQFVKESFDISNTVKEYEKTYVKS